MVAWWVVRSPDAGEVRTGISYRDRRRPGSWSSATFRRRCTAQKRQGVHNVHTLPVGLGRVMSRDMGDSSVSGHR